MNNAVSTAKERGENEWKLLIWIPQIVMNENNAIFTTQHDIQLRCFYLMRQNVVTSYELQVVINLGCIFFGRRRATKRAENK